MQQPCSECRRLQQELIESNKALLNIVGEMQKAVLAQDAGFLSRTKALLDEATKRCETVRLALEEHRSAHD
jgi:hypothetical protein